MSARLSVKRNELTDLPPPARDAVAVGSDSQWWLDRISTLYKLKVIYKPQNAKEGWIFIWKTKYIHEIIDDDECILLCGGITPRIPKNGSRRGSLVS
jgi:hypothetical protein